MGPWLLSHGRLSLSPLVAARAAASMGPWLLSHGRARNLVGRSTDRRASMGPWLLSHGRSVGFELATAKNSFNGAVASQPRKDTALPHRCSRSRWASMGPWLLSHGRTFRRRRFTAARRASMGPWLLSHGRNRSWQILGTGDAGLQWGRGFSATEGGGRGTFAESALLLQWGRGFSATEGCSRVSAIVIPAWLQWGRGFSATEGHRRNWRDHPLSRASMGPWLLSHGRERHQLQHFRERQASMGPWLLSHGRLHRRQRSWLPCHQLQWGRGFSATEGPATLKSSD